jgi:HlyD family secretion protein
MKKLLNLIALLSIISILLTACAAAPTTTPVPESAALTNEVIAEGRLEPLRGTNLSFQARGVVEDVLVKAGDTVQQGDVLARLANSGGAEAQVVVAQNAYDVLLRNESGDRATLWQAYMDAQIARAAAEKKWEELNVDDIENRIEDSRAVVEDRQEDLKDAQEEFDKYKDLDEDNSKRKSAEDELERSQEALNQANRDLEDDMRERDEIRVTLDTALSVEAEARHQYEISLDGPNADQLSLAKANLDAAQDALSNYVLTAPFNGVVAEVNVSAGEQVTAETRVVSVADFKSWTVKTTDVTELEVVKLSIGQKVLLVPDALPDLELHGTVVEISDAYTQQGGDILYTVRVQVDDPHDRLRWGMTVEATFLE